jgi:sec-independent protein translocase protein TatB
VFNVTGGEVIIILVLALIVLGPEKLPDAIRRFARFYGEFKKMSSGFQNELRNALDEPMQELRSTAELLKQQIDQPTSAINDTAALAKQQLEAAAAAAATADATGTPPTPPPTADAPPEPASEPASDAASEPTAQRVAEEVADDTAGDDDGVPGDCDGPAPDEWQRHDEEAPKA